MRRKKRFLRWLIGVVCTIALVLTALDIYAETAGLPGFVVRMVDGWMRDSGIHSQSGDMRFGLVNWLIIDDFTVMDPELGIVLLEAERFEVKPSIGRFFSDSGTPFEFVIRNGDVNLPVTDPQAEGDVKILRLSKVDAQGVVCEATRLLELDTTSVVNDKLKLHFSFIGNLKESDQETLTLKPLVDSLPEEVLDGVETLENVIASADASTELVIDCRVLADLNKPETADITITPRIRSLLYNGMVVEQLDAKLRVKRSLISLQDLRMQIDENETLNASATWERDTNTVEAKLSGQTFPKKLAKAIIPQHLDAFKDFGLQGPPPTFTLILHPTPVGKLRDAHVELDFSIRDAAILDGQIRYAQASVEYKDRKIHINNFRANALPTVDAWGSAVYDTETGDLHIRAQQLGEPLAICDFLPYKEVVSGIRTGFRGFEFSPLARPRFEMDFLLTRSNGKPCAFIVGNMACKAFSYHGAELDSMRGAVTVDTLNELVVIDRLHVERDGAAATGQVVVDFSQKSGSVHFDAESSIESSALMQLIWEDWRDMLSKMGIRFETTPHLKGSGYVSLKDAKDHHIFVRARVDKVLYGNAVGKKGDVMLEFKMDDIRANGSFESGTLEGLDFLDVNVRNFRYTPEGVTVNVNAKQAGFGESLFDSCTAQVTIDSDGKKVTILNASARQFKVPGNEMDLIMSNVSSPNLLIDIEKGIVNGSVAAETVSQSLPKSKEEVTQAKDLKVKQLRWQKDKLVLNGDMESVYYAPLQARAKTATFKSEVKKTTVDARISIPELKLQRGVTFHKIDVQTSVAGDQTNAGFKIAGFDYGDITGKGVSGKLGLEGKSFEIKDARCEVLEALPVRLTDLRGRALSAFDILSIQLEDGTLTIVPKTKVDRSGKARFPMIVERIKARMTKYENKLDVRDFTGDFYGGSIMGDAETNFKESETKLALTFSAVDLEKLVNRGLEEPGEDSKLNGFLTGQTILRLVHDKNGLLIFGPGSAKLRKATLWKVPLLSDFLSLLRSKFGKITKMDCEFRFNGDRLDIIGLKTNGNVVSVQANGYYWWKTEGIDMRFEAALFKLGIFKKVLAKRMIGHIDDYQWESLSGIIDLFRDTKTPVDPTLSTENGKK